MKDFIDVILWLWQAPQHIVAFIIYKLIFKSILPAWSRDYTEATGLFSGCIIYIFSSTVRFPGVSLGRYIFIRNDFQGEELDNVKRHEWGHSVQSRILGPLYLIIVGFPGLILNLLSDFIKAVYNDYYNYPTEKWADQIGKVTREQVYPGIFRDNYVLTCAMHIWVCLLITVSIGLGAVNLSKSMNQKSDIRDAQVMQELGYGRK